MTRFIAALLLLFAAPLTAQSMQFPAGPTGAAAIAGQPIAPSTVTATGTVSGTTEIRVTGASASIRSFKWQSAGVDTGSDITVGGDDSSIFYRVGVSGTHQFQINATNVLNIASSGIASLGNIVSSNATGGVGYSTGAGGAVTQLTSRTTGVALNKMCGAVTLFSTTTTAGQVTTFTVADTGVTATDVIVVDQKTGANIYIPTVTAIAAGSFNVSVYTPAAATAEAPVMQFCAFRGANS